MLKNKTKNKPTKSSRRPGYIIFIDPRDHLKLVIGIVATSGVWLRRATIMQQRGSNRLLPTLVRLLDAVTSSDESLRGVVVVRGPGRFTTVRVAVTTAMTLAWAKKIPVIGLIGDNTMTAKDLARIGLAELSSKPAAKWSVIEPWYDQQPNITTTNPRK